MKRLLQLPSSFSTSRDSEHGGERKKRERKRSKRGKVLGKKLRERDAMRVEEEEVEGKVIQRMRRNE